MKSKKAKDRKTATKSASDIENAQDQPQGIHLSENLLNEFARFYDYHPAKRFNRNLRSLILEFPMYDGYAEAEYLKELVIDCDGLFALLDAMQDEQHKHHIETKSPED